MHAEAFSCTRVAQSIKSISLLLYPKPSLILLVLPSCNVERGPCPPFVNDAICIPTS